MPFVNRLREIFQLLCANIDAILALQAGEVDDFRPLKVSFSAQMFGSGKTTLGRNFMSQIQSDSFEQYARKALSKRSDSQRAAWMAEYREAKGARTVYVDVGGRPAMADVVLLLKQLGKSTFQALDPISEVQQFAEVVWDIATQQPGTPLFVHIDELGDLGRKVQMVRNGVRATWKKMNNMRGEQMPRIFFFLSGKSIPLDAVGSWVLLDHLHPEHIEEILEHLSNLNQNEKMKLPLRVPLGTNLKMLATKLYVATGGAPRLLLYSLRCLHHLTITNSLTDLSNEKNIEDAMDLVYEKLCLVSMVTSELFVAKTETQDLQRAWLGLLMYAELGVELKQEDQMQLSSTKKISMGELLRLLNVYVTGDGTTSLSSDPSSKSFKVHIFDFVRRFAKQHFADDPAIPLFYKSGSGSQGASASASASALLEVSVEQRLLVRYSVGSKQWRELLPMLKNSKLANDKAVLNAECPVRTFPKVTTRGTVLSRESKQNMSEEEWLSLKTIRREDFADFMSAVAPNYLYSQGDRASSSADSIVAQEGWKLELQAKALTSKALGWADVRQEVAKSLPEPHNVTLVIIALKLKEELEQWVNATPDGILTLDAADYEVYEVGAGARGHLRRDGEWLAPVPPEDQNAEKRQSSELKIREGMEVVIPSLSQIKEFLGEDDVNSIQKVAEGEPMNVSLVSLFLQPGQI